MSVRKASRRAGMKRWSILSSGYRARLRFNERAAAELLEQAADLMAQAKACHDELETYYRAAVDFGKVDEAAAQCAGMLGLA